jgi:uncharacterized protein (DUF2236 family)
MHPVEWLHRRLELPSSLGPGTPGDPGLFGPASAVWRIGRERVLLAGGPAALLMQLAHPLIAAAVTRHSDFCGDPFRRLRATLQAVLSITFGDRAQAEAAAAAVRAIHARVRGMAPRRLGAFPAGTPYRAADPELAMWVHSTLVLSALESFGRLVRPLDESEREAYWQESKRFAELFGVTGEILPRSVSDFDAYMAGTLQGSELEVGPEALALSAEVLDPKLPASVRPAARLMGPIVTAGLLPEPLRRAYSLAWGAVERGTFRSVAAGIRRTLPAWDRSVRFWPQYAQAMDRVAPATGFH